MEVKKSFIYLFIFIVLSVFVYSIADSVSIGYINSNYAKIGTVNGNLSRIDSDLHNINSSNNATNYWDYLNTPADISLDDLSSTIDSSQTFNVGGNIIDFVFTNPVGGIVFNWTAAASGHLFTLTQTGASIPPGVSNHILHIDSDDADVVDVHIEHGAGTGEALRIEGGYVNVTDKIYSNGSLVCTSKNGYCNQTASGGNSSQDMINAVNISQLFQLKVDCNNVLFSTGYGSASICDGVDATGGGGGSSIFFVEGLWIYSNSSAGGTQYMSIANFNTSIINVSTMVYGDVTGALTGNADTATALAANGANCAAGSYPLGVDDSGAVEDCTDATTEINSAISTHAATKHGNTTTEIRQQFTGSNNISITSGQIAINVSFPVDTDTWNSSTDILNVLKNNGYNTTANIKTYFDLFYNYLDYGDTNVTALVDAAFVKGLGFNITTELTAYYNTLYNYNDFDNDNVSALVDLTFVQGLVTNDFHNLGGTDATNTTVDIWNVVNNNTFIVGQTAYTGNTETNIVVTYQTADQTVDFVVPEMRNTTIDVINAVNSTCLVVGGLNICNNCINLQGGGQDCFY